MEKAITSNEELNILVVGNNPGDLGRVFESLENIPDKRIITEIAFDLKSIFERLGKFTPAFILIDDNIGKIELTSAVKALLKFKKTKSIPITILKNSNYHEAINSGVMNYVLKKDLTGATLFKELENSVKFKNTQKFLFEAYKKRRGQMRRLLK